METTSVKIASQTQQVKRNKWAVYGFELSLLSIIGIGIAGLAGMIMGVVALNQIKQTKERGKGFAIAAIVIGAVFGITSTAIWLAIEYMKYN